VAGEGLVVFGVNAGELFLCEWDFSEGIAEAEAAVQEHRLNGDFFQPGWDFDV